MNIDTVLESDLDWRTAELVSLKRLAINAEKGSTAHRSLLRAMWAMLYAHFEGFTKFCWDTILDHIQNENLTKGQLSDEFALITLEKEFRLLRGALSGQAIMKFIRSDINVAFGSSVEFPDEVRLKTNSNLWPNVFEDESQKNGIVCEELDKHRQKIKSLVARRNEIAHGKSMTIESVEEYHIYEDATLCIMNELAIKIIEIINARQYVNASLKN
jgi:hypothetical protein